MLTHPTLEKLQALRLSGMVKGLEEQMQMIGLEDLGFVERLGIRSTVPIHKAGVSVLEPAAVESRPTVLQAAHPNSPARPPS